jgi:alkylation response protein AidB-like acyl-CoA dehydrogenase
MLLRRASGRPLVALSTGGRFEHGDLFPEWEGTASDGAVLRFDATPDLIGSKVGPFVNRTAARAIGDATPLTQIEECLLHVLPSWYVLGALEQALGLATEYATQRVQFGAAISTYQGVAFPLADACAELQALYELALHTSWSVYESPGTARADALALRWSALDIGRRVLRIAHQAMGAVGLCDEHDLTIITLALQARLRLPSDLERSMAALAGEVARSGLDSIFIRRGAVPE